MHASGCPKLRPASANQSLGRLWPPMPGCFRQVQSHAHDFAWLAESTRGTVADALLQQSAEQLYAWWGVQQRTFLPQWIRDVEQVTTAEPIQ